MNMMKHEPNLELLQPHAIPERILIEPGQGGLERIRVRTAQSTAEIYPHGAHVTGFQKCGEPALLFMSQSSQFAPGQPIRGGVPIVFPWFGPREGASAHGFGRLTRWDLCETAATPEGHVRLRFELPPSAVKNHGLDARVHYEVTVGSTLTMELSVTNPAAKAALTFETCLHTYFAVGDIGAVSITGLKGVSYLDRLESSACKVEAAEAVRFSCEVDRTYQETTGPVEIRDMSLRRVICVEKSGSNSTVVWNPWVAKSKAMPDFGNEEYQRMVCVESGNVADQRVTLEPGCSTTLKVVLSSRPI
jgi:D-hexose-6-phosphate mutarotase